MAGDLNQDITVVLHIGLLFLSGFHRPMFHVFSVCSSFLVSSAILLFFIPFFFVCVPFKCLPFMLHGSSLFFL